MRLVEKAIRLERGVREVEVLFMGCCHVGHVGCIEESISAVAEYIAAAPHRYLVLLGDVVDAINVTDSRFNPREVAPWLQAHDLSNALLLQCERAALLLRPVPPGRLLGVVEGNHPRKARTQYFVDLNRHLCRLLVADNLGESAILRLGFQGRDAGPAEIDLYVEHGAGGAGTPEAVLTQLKKRAGKHPGADAYVGSHHHKAAFSTVTTTGLARNGAFSLEHVETPVVTAGCHLSYYERDAETYGECYHMPVANIGPAKLRLYPWGKPGAFRRSFAREQRVSVTWPWWS